MRELGDSEEPRRGSDVAEKVWIRCVSEFLCDEDIPESASPSERLEKSIALTIQFVMSSPPADGGSNGGH
jgi:hypothetical protein